jgi:small subunit ribosomal protein S4
MARYLGPKCRIMRSLGMDLSLKSRIREIETKCKINNLPGQHGANKKSRPSDFGLQLKAKQIIRNMYGILEKQFKNYYIKASKRRGKTGEILLQLLECRLDNIVYRMGFGSTRAESRQLIVHNAIEVNNKIVSIPSFQVSKNDIIKVSKKALKQIRIKNSLKIAEEIGFPKWVKVDVSKMEGIFSNTPDRSDLSPEINEQLVIELYSK